MDRIESLKRIMDELSAWAEEGMAKERGDRHAPALEPAPEAEIEMTKIEAKPEGELEVETDELVKDMSKDGDSAMGATDDEELDPETLELLKKSMG